MEVELGLDFIRWWIGAIGRGCKEPADSQQPTCYSCVGGVAKPGHITNSPQISVAYKTKVYFFLVLQVGCALALVLLHILSHSVTCPFYCS